MGEEGLPEPKAVVYHPVTGVPEEFHDFLHKDTDEYKRLKQSREASTSEVGDKVASLSMVRAPPRPARPQSGTSDFAAPS